MRSVILHLDMDCYYAQCESKRLGLPSDVPLAVSQWGGLLAVNYAARSFGVRRGDRVEAAIQKCPQLRTPHVAVIGGRAGSGMNDPVPEGTSSSSDAIRELRRESKITLDFYRSESAHVFEALASVATSAKIERASIDEAYIDITSLAASELEEARQQGAAWFEDIGRRSFLGSGRRAAEANRQERQTYRRRGHPLDVSRGGDQNGRDHGGPWVDDGGSGRVSGEGGAEGAEEAEEAAEEEEESEEAAAWRVDLSDPMDAMLLAGAAVCERLREAVLVETGHTVSGGIAHTKAVAKLASARNKPDKQTVVPQRVVPLVMRAVPLCDLRGLGGKEGAAVAEALPDVRTLGELACVPVERLVALFGRERANWLSLSSRGEWEEPVKPVRQLESNGRPRVSWNRMGDPASAGIEWAAPRHRSLILGW